jgi:stage II sporulation protein D
VNGREYPGALEIVRSGDTLTVINELPLEEYLAGAVKAEAGDKMPLEMLKAQAVVARTYAAYHRRLNAENAFHIVASTLNQQYSAGTRRIRQSGR